jgi:hypothetical protein
MGTLKEWEKKNARILIPAVLIGMVLFVLFIFYDISGSDGENLADATNIEEAKSGVDYLINSWDEQYKELCDGPRNGTTKEEFTNLSFDIRAISGAGEMCEKLDFELQRQVQDYANARFEKYSHLNNLTNSAIIDCW